MLVATLLITTIGLLRRWWRRRTTTEETVDSGPERASPDNRAGRPPVRRRLPVLAAALTLIGIALATSAFVQC
jgi:hypothetical protein